MTSYDQQDIEDRVLNLVDFLKIKIPYLKKEDIVAEVKGFPLNLEKFCKVAELYLGLHINSDVKEKISKLSTEYWNYKGFYKFPLLYKGFSCENLNLNNLKYFL